MQQSQKHKVLLLFAKKVKDQHHGVYWEWSCHNYWQEEETFLRSLTIWNYFSHSFIDYCSLIFHNICRKCWTNVWMKKDREARRLWQLLQRYLINKCMCNVDSMCVMRNTEFRHLLLFHNYIYQALHSLYLEEADSTENEHICYIPCLDTEV